HLLAFANDAARYLAAQAAEIMQRVVRRIVRPVDPLHGETQRGQIPVARDVYILQMTEQGRTFEPRRVLGGFYHIVAVEGAHGDELHIAEHVQLRQKIFDLVADLLEAFLFPVHKVHLVDGDDEVGDAQQRRDVRVPARLLDHTL